MNNLLFGVLSIVFCGIGYFFSWKYWKNDNYKIALLLLIICGFILRVYTSFDFFLHPWDERYHALVAKNLMQHPLLPTLYNNPILPNNYKDWTASYVWLHKQPLPLWTIATSMYLFGVNEIALRIPSIIFTTLGIWITFYIGRYFFNKKVGYLTAFFYSINGLIIEITAGRVATDHTDVFFLFFIELAVFFSILFIQKRKTIYTVFTSLSIGAAILSKWLPALIVLPIWLLLVIDSGSFKPKAIAFQFTLLVVITFAAFFPWQLYIYSHFPLEAAWENGFNFKHFTQVLEKQTGSFNYFIDRMRINYGELIYLPVLWFLWKTYKEKNNLKRWAICIWVLIPVIFFSFAKTKMQAYILFVAPALFIMIADFYFMLKDYKKTHGFKWLINVVLLLLLVLPIRYMLERVKPFETENRSPQWVINLKQINERKIKKGIIFNYDKPIEAMFYTNLTAYNILPEKGLLQKLIRQGYFVIIDDTGNIPEDIKLIKGIYLEKLSLKTFSVQNSAQDKHDEPVHH
ncbi:MAG: glycosyltransferase family 39 protein [Bacteroidia bacterium]